MILIQDCRLCPSRMVGGMDEDVEVMAAVVIIKEVDITITKVGATTREATNSQTKKQSRKLLSKNGKKRSMMNQLTLPMTRSCFVTQKLN